MELGSPIKNSVPLSITLRWTYRFTATGKYHVATHVGIDLSRICLTSVLVPEKLFQRDVSFRLWVRESCVILITISRLKHLPHCPNSNGWLLGNIFNQSITVVSISGECGCNQSLYIFCGCFFTLRSTLRSNNFCFKFFQGK